MSATTVGTFWQAPSAKSESVLEGLALANTSPLRPALRRFLALPAETSPLASLTPEGSPQASEVSFVSHSFMFLWLSLIDARRPLLEAPPRRSLRDDRRPTLESPLGGPPKPTVCPHRAPRATSGPCGDARLSAARSRRMRGQLP